MPTLGVTWNKPRPTLGAGATHLPAAPYSSQGGELKTGDKFPSDAGAFRTPRGGVSRSDGVGLFFFLSFLFSFFVTPIAGRDRVYEIYNIF